VLEKIAQHRPHLGPVIRNLHRWPELAPQLEQALAINYLMGETQLSALETRLLAACTIGQPYGGEQSQ
jgi:hypothetical protein